MKQRLFAAVLIIGSFGYVWMQRGLTTQNTVIPTAPIIPEPTVSTPARTETSAEDDDNVPLKPPAPKAIPPAPKSVPVSATKYKDGTYTGKPASEPYGTVQVAVVIKGGTIIEVQLLQKPSDGPRAVQVNSFALPLLVQETLVAQSANIDGISGASLTSPVYIESLKSALSQAQI